MKKSKFKKMSLNEWLGDPATHFLKSGSAFRNKENDALRLLSESLPRKSPSGLNVEYDITYDFPEKVHGYKYTDCLTKMVYVAPCSFRIAKENIARSCSLPITEEGERVFAQLAQAATDKYVQSSEYLDYVSEQVIMLPGTNLLTIDDYVDFEKIDQLVAQGAKVKLHPVTSKVWCTMLQRRWGKAVVPKRVSAYGLMREAKKVYFTMSSETGMSCVLLGKEIGLVQQKQTKKQSTFEAIYRGMDGCEVKRTLRDKLKAMLSQPQSGLVTVFHDNPQQRVQHFFEHMLNTYPHKEVSPT